MSYAWGNQADAGKVYVSIERDDGNKIVTSRELEKLTLTDESRIHRYIYDNLASDGSFSGCTKSCEDALRRFRLPDKPRTLWVDAICINQKDNVERTRQVQMMGHIYHNAERVIAYSGHAARPSWNDLLGSRYFKRLWPVQEILHARNIRLYYGDSSVDWDVLYRAYESLESKTADVGSTDSQSTTSAAVEPSDFFELRQWYLTNPPREFPLSVEDQRIHRRLPSVGRLDASQLVTILRMTAAQECKEPLDKFYAVQSLFYGEPYNNIEPNYSKSVPDLHRELVRIVGRKYERELRALLRVPPVWNR